MNGDSFDTDRRMGDFARDKLKGINLVKNDKLFGVIPPWIFCIITFKQLAFLAITISCGFLSMEDAFDISSNNRKSIQIMQWCMFGISVFFGVVTSIMGINQETFLICDKSVTADVFFRHMVVSIFAIMMTYSKWNNDLDDVMYMPSGPNAGGVMQFTTTNKYHLIAAPILCLLFWVDASITVQKGFASLVANLFPKQN